MLLLVWVKVNGSFSIWARTILGVLQGSVLGPIFFNIYLHNLFMFLEETKICSNADDATIYVCGPEIETVLTHLEGDAFKITE